MHRALQSFALYPIANCDASHVYTFIARDNVRNLVFTPRCESDPDYKKEKISNKY